MELLSIGIEFWQGVMTAIITVGWVFALIKDAHDALRR